MNDLGWTDPIRALACATLSPGLNSALIWDAPFSDLESLARAWGQIIERAIGMKTERLVISPTESDETLFGQWAPGAEALRWIDGLLVKRNGRIPVYVIPDLATLELPGRRALLVALSEDVIHLERDGRSMCWDPCGYWLASCRREDVGRLSPHLLDRFALRLDQSAMSQSNRVQYLRNALEQKVGIDQKQPLPENLALARSTTLPITDQALSAILDILPQLDVGSRRILALARLATGLAKLDNAKKVHLTHVQGAVELLGGPPIHKQDPVQPDTPPEPDSRPRERDSPVSEDVATKDIEQHPILDEPLRPEEKTSDAPEGEQITPIYPSPSETVLAVDELRSSIGLLYAEDDSLLQRESFSLRLGFLPPGRKTVPRGPIIGSLPASDLRDISVTATLIEAAKFQAIRRHDTGDDEGLQIRSGDLRKHRRLPKPDRLLLLVIDYTAVDALPWHTTLVPALQEAYVQRAGIAIVQVGAADAPHPLRANIVRARSLLSPAVERALSAQAGAATPLAHGLELAADILRSSLHRGRNSNVEAKVMIYTDGRGNVTRESSLAGESTKPISRQGIEDALKAAQQLREINHVKCLVVSPRLMVYQQLPQQLAAEMNGQIAYLPSEFAEGLDE